MDARNFAKTLNGLENHHHDVKFDLSPHGSDINSASLRDLESATLYNPGKMPRHSIMKKPGSVEKRKEQGGDQEVFKFEKRKNSSSKNLYSSKPSSPAFKRSISYDQTDPDEAVVEQKTLSKEKLAISKMEKIGFFAQRNET
jgi:hypothetical protein